MRKKLGIIVSLIIFGGSIAGGYVYQQINSQVTRLTPELEQNLRKAVAAENESAIRKPEFRQRAPQPANPLKNVYFGETHVHTAWSFDSYLSGNRFSPEEAYRFAQGHPIELFSGEIARLSTPLDFVAVTDHAESFGLFDGCGAADLNAKQEAFCAQFDDPSLKLLFNLKRDSHKRPPRRPADICLEDGSFCQEHGKTTWKKLQQAADDAYIPGEFTTFYAYEYSPVWPDKGATHRNVFFRSDRAPDEAVSAFDASTALDLWRILEQTCQQDCEFLTIPHNMNRYQGKAYSRLDEDGNPYTIVDWERRARFEPLAEIFQSKGSSECALGLNTADEECAYEQFYPLCEDEITGNCAREGSYARDGLKLGLTLEKEVGFNPLQFGFIGSTDNHRSSPGDVEEWDWRGKSGIRDLTAKKRLGEKPLKPGNHLAYNPGGLAAIWAEENTREALFDAMKKKETYATSGTRIRLRFFGGWNLTSALLNQPDTVASAYETGVPMGSVLPTGSETGKPTFLVWAAKDPVGANLDRIQMVKSWVENGRTEEAVFDIACSNGLTPNPTSGKCPDNGARVDPATCQITEGGDTELNVVWRDEAFNPDHSAFYYVRVLQNPTCRWSGYDAIRLGLRLPQSATTTKERAWSSPIWYTAN